MEQICEGELCGQPAKALKEECLCVCWCAHRWQTDLLQTGVVPLNRISFTAHMLTQKFWLKPDAKYALKWPQKVLV